MVPRIAAATALKAQEQGLAQLSRTKVQVMEGAAERIRQVRETVRLVMKEGGIDATISLMWGILPPSGDSGKTVVIWKLKEVA